jgi:hypothetical protein
MNSKVTTITLVTVNLIIRDKTCESDGVENLPTVTSLVNMN